MANGSVATLLSGGTEPYTYLWSNGGTNPLINNLVAGTYSLTVTDNNGCTSTLIASVTQPPVLLPSITTIAVACNGDASGEAAVSTAGGTPPYMFQWSNGATTTMINELTAGVYSLTITDQNQCQAIEVANITEPPPLSSIIDQVNATCIGYSDGSIDVMVTGGTTPYEYRWSTGDNQPNLDNLAAGAYSITITDSNGCSLVESMDIIEAYPLTIDPWTDRVLSLGDSLELQVVSNIGPNEVDQYTWITQTDTIQCNTCSTYSDLPLRSGCLTVFVESIYGCTESATLCFDVEALRRVYMPNVFKPNSGNDNAAVVLFSDSSVQNIKKLMFFDRWGTLLYHAENIPPNSNAAGWDGTYRGSSMAPGVYIWAAEVEFVDGKTEVFQGDVTLIR
jgi:gliding motility-associated-like protein